jgi:2-methylcitrate dehydratase
MSTWKGFVAPHTAFASLHATFLAMRGLTGPGRVFEGPKGFFEATGSRARIDWSAERLDVAARTAIKPYNAEVHTQSVLEAVLDLRQEEPFAPTDVGEVRVETFKVAYDITGGGAWGDRHDVRVKEDADHSLPYMVAVAILDGQVMPEQYEPERIARDDVQALLRRVSVTWRHRYTRRYPDEMPCRVMIRLRDGRTLVKEKRDFAGFPTRPQSWDDVERKFVGLATPFTSAPLRRALIRDVGDLDRGSTRDLTDLLGSVDARGQASQAASI